MTATQLAKGLHPAIRRRALQGSIGANDRGKCLSRTIVGVHHLDSLLRQHHSQAGVDRHLRHVTDLVEHGGSGGHP